MRAGGGVQSEANRSSIGIRFDICPACRELHGITEACYQIERKGCHLNTRVPSSTTEGRISVLIFSSRERSGTQACSGHALGYQH